MSEKNQKRCQLLLNRLKEILQNDKKEILELEEEITKLKKDLKEQYILIQQKEKVENTIKREIEALGKKRQDVTGQD